MKKLVLSLVMVLGLVATASAAVKEFNAVKMDVPDGWTAQEQGPMVMVVSPEQNAVVTVIVAPSQGQTAKQIAETGAKSVKGSAVKDEGKGVYSFTFEAQGQKGTMYVSTSGDNGVVTTVLGENPQLAAVAKSVQPK